MKQHVRPYLRMLLLSSMMAGVVPAIGAGDGCHTATNLTVKCSRASSLVQLNLSGCKKMGKITIEVRDQHGRTLYREEGRALTGELIRNLDKGTFPRGTHEVTVSSKEFAVSQRFTIE